MPPIERDDSLYAVFVPDEEPGYWQYALMAADGSFVELEGVPRVATRNLVRRRMVPASQWQEVHDVDL